MKIYQTRLPSQNQTNKKSTFLCLSLVFVTVTSSCAQTLPPDATTPATMPLDPRYDGSKPLGNLFYGAGAGIVTASNTNIKGDDQQPSVSKRFMAPRSGSISGILWHARRNTGAKERGTTYSGGNGGKIKIQLRLDDGKGHWTNTVLAETAINNGDPKSLCDGEGNGPGPREQHVRWDFLTPPPVVQGQWYHLVFCNMDENPNINYISENSSQIHNPNIPTNEPWGGPVFKDYNIVTPRSPRRGFTMAAELKYTDGFNWSTGYWLSAGVARNDVGGKSKVRELFTVSGWSKGAAFDRRVKTFYVFVRKSKADAGDLTVALKNGDGTVLEQQNLQTDQFPVNKSVWREGTFSKAYTLVAGRKYSVELSSSIDGSYRVAPVMEEPQNLGYSDLNTWNGGLFERTSDGGTTWEKARLWNSDRSDTDLPFLFKLEP
jgi:hypothetical protein